jgi:hypothetical protein
LFLAFAAEKLGPPSGWITAEKFCFAALIPSLFSRQVLG